MIAAPVPRTKLMFCTCLHCTVMSVCWPKPLTLNTFFSLILFRVFTDPIHLDRARKTKTPTPYPLPPSPPTSWWIMSITPLESLSAEESEAGGGTVVLYWLMTTLSPTSWPFQTGPQTTVGWWITSATVKTSHLTTTPGFACVNASFKSAINPSKTHTTIFYFHRKNTPN